MKDLFKYVFIIVSALSLININATILSNLQQNFLGISNGLRFGSLVPGDINNDGKIDLIGLGLDRSNKKRLIVFTNSGLKFAIKQEPMGVGLGLDNGSLSLVDINNDGWLDLCANGMDSVNYRFIIFTNNKSTFSIQQEPMGINQGFWSKPAGVVFKDINNDGKQDCIITGEGSINYFQSYTNLDSALGIHQNINGIGNGFSYSCLGYSVDAESKHTIVVIGFDNAMNERFILYTNQGFGFFPCQEPLGINNGVNYGFLAIGDIDSDNDDDLIISGDSGSGGRLITFENNSGVYLKKQEPLGVNKGLYLSSGSLIDVNSDGKLDLIVTGGGYGLKKHLIVFTNNNGFFYKAEEPLNFGVITNGLDNAAIIPLDVDDNGKSDIVISGIDEFNKAVLMVLKNTCTIPNAPPPSPAGLNVENVNGYWKLKWAPVSGDDHTSAIMMRYNVAYGTNPGVYSWGTTNITYPTGQANLGNVADNVGCTFQTRIPENKRVYWKVCAIDTSFKNSTYSAENAGPAVPTAPTFISANVISTNRIDLAWHALPNESSFTLYRNTLKTTNGAVKIGFARDMTNASDLGLLPNTKYYYALQACNVSGKSGLSAFVSNTTPPRAPSKPLWASSLPTGASSMDLKWLTLSNVSSYTLFRNATGSTSLFSGQFGIVGSTNYSDSGLTIDTKYYYWLRAYNVTGKSPLSDVMTNRTWPQVPDQPVVLKAITTSTDAIRVVWQPLGNVSGFTLFRNTSSATTGLSFAGSAGPTATNLAATGLTPGEKYWFFLRAWNITGVSALSAAVTNRTLAGGVLVPPAFISATLNPPSTINLVWNDLNNETNYSLYRSMTNNSTNNATLIATMPRNQTNYADSGLPLNTSCFYWLKARNMKGASAYSSFVSNRTAVGDTNAPNEVSGLSATSRRGDSRFAPVAISLSWMNPTNKDFGGIRIVKKLGSPPSSTNDGTVINIASTNYGSIFSYDDAGVLKNATLYYRIYTYDVLGNISMGRNVSVFSGNSLEEKEIIFNQNPVHPDKGETLVLEYTEDASARVTFDVYTVTGTFICKLTGTANRVEWDCRNGSGQMCARGIYLLVMKVDGKKVFKDAIKVAVER